MKFPFVSRKLSVPEKESPEFTLPSETTSDVTDQHSGIPSDVVALSETDSEYYSSNDVEPLHDSLNESTLGETSLDESVSDITSIDPALSDMVILLQQLAHDFEQKLKYDRSKQSQIDKLYDENQKYKDGFLKKFQNSLMLTVIEQIDEAMKQIMFFTCAEYSEANFQKLLRSYQDIAAGFQDMLLEKFEVVNYRCDPETPFDPRRQRALKSTPTDDFAKNKLVKQTLRLGYETAEGFILRPELVEVYVWEHPKDAIVESSPL